MLDDLKARKSYYEMKRMAEDREVWRALIHGTRPVDRQTTKEAYIMGGKKSQNCS